MLGQTRECRGCGVEFVQERAGQRYHDPACQIRSNNAKQAVKRVDLNREYKRRRYDEARPWREFVCEGCGAKVLTRELRKRRFCKQKCKDAVRGREWQRDNKERVRQYRSETRERRTAVHAKWRDANLAQQQEYVRSYAQATRSNTPWRFLIAGAKTRAKAKGMPFDLTLEWAIERWTGRCELTGIPFKCGQPQNAPRMFGPTIDRIRPSEGYTQSNCRFILHGINALKGEETDENMYLLAEALLKNRPSN